MIVLPMAGLSQRFAKAGYTEPKYMLPLGGDTVFARVARSFEAYFASERFLFICRDVQATPAFVTDQCQKLGIARREIVVLDAPTRGQAETVWEGLRRAQVGAETPIAIFNIDTIRPGLRFPPVDPANPVDGYLEVFRGEGAGWSFARTRSSADMTVVEVAEKRRISDLCSTGLYYFRRSQDFMDAFSSEARKPQAAWDAAELYVAPLYNHLIHAGKKVVAAEIEAAAMIPCGIPEEYEALKQRYAPEYHGG